MPGATLERKAVLIYRFAAIAASVEAFLLFVFGLDLTTQQSWIFLFFGLPATFVMYGADRWLIGCYVRPIRPALDQLDMLETSRSLDAAFAYRAWVQTLNLPTLTLLRVLIVHAPAVLLPISLLCWGANRLAGLDMARWQFVVLWCFWPITAAPHAILEYFFIDRSVRPILFRLDPHVRLRVLQPQLAANLPEVLRMLAGQELPEPRIIRTAMATQLAWLFVFVSLMPMLVLGASAYLKISVGSVTTIGVWIALLIGINALVSLAIVALMSMRMHRSMYGKDNKRRAKCVERHLIGAANGR